MSSDRRKRFVHDRLQNGGQNGVPPAFAKRTQASVLLTEKGWASPRNAADATHEWAYVDTKSDGTKLFRCMRCRLVKIANRNWKEPGYSLDGESMQDCRPCSNQVAVPQPKQPEGDSK